MENKYIFRGKIINSDTWLYGYLLSYRVDDRPSEPESFFIIPFNEVGYETLLAGLNEVNPATVSQGVYINGTLYYGGDVLLWNGYSVEIVWRNNAWALKCISRYTLKPQYMDIDQLKLVPHFKLLGNVFDDPELMEVPK